MTHALVRTSPTGKGKLFVGYCMKCGAENLGMVAALQPCPADDAVSDQQALLDILGDNEAIHALPEPNEASHD